MISFDKIYNDSSGNLNSTDVTFNVDATAPLISVFEGVDGSVGNAEITSNNTAEIRYSSLDNNLDSCWYSNDSMLVNTTLSGCINISGVTWSEGNHNVTIYSNDTFGNSDSIAINFTLDSVNPAWSNNGTNLTSSTSKSTQK